jgi:hypothetical protein
MAEIKMCEKSNSLLHSNQPKDNHSKNPKQIRKTALYKNGILLEKFAVWFLIQKLGFNHKQISHNDFSPEKYPFEHDNIVDIKIEDLALIEVTNPKESTFMNDEIMQKKIDYFERADFLHKFIWILIMSFANISNAIRKQLEDKHIFLIELNVTATNRNRHAIKRALFKTKINAILNRLIHYSQPAFFGTQVSKSKSIQVSNTVQSVNTVTVNNQLQLPQPLTSTSLGIELITKLDIDALYTEIFGWRNGIRTG